MSEVVSATPVDARPHSAGRTARFLGGLLIEVAVWTLIGGVTFMALAAIVLLGGPDLGRGTTFDISLGIYIAYHAVRRSREGP